MRIEAMVATALAAVVVASALSMTVVAVAVQVRGPAVAAHGARAGGILRGAAEEAASGAPVGVPRPHIVGRRAAAVAWTFLSSLSDEWDGTRVDHTKWRDFNPIWYVAPLFGKRDRSSSFLAGEGHQLPPIKRTRGAELAPLESAFESVRKEPHENRYMSLYDVLYVWRLGLDVCMLKLRSSLFSCSSLCFFPCALRGPFAVDLQVWACPRCLFSRQRVLAVGHPAAGGAHRPRVRFSTQPAGRAGGAPPVRKLDIGVCGEHGRSPVWFLRGPFSVR